MANASAHYDFRLVVPVPDADGGESAKSPVPGDLTVLRKGTESVVARIHVDRVVVALGKGGEPVVNSTYFSLPQGVIDVGDFDFDGNEDFAVPESYEGLIGCAIFRVFLYDAGQGTFREAPALSQLTRKSFGLFTVDTAQKRLLVSMRDGCCSTVTTTYEVSGGLPNAVVRVTTIARGDDEELTEERLVGGGWVRKTTHQHIYPPP